MTIRFILLQLISVTNLRDLDTPDEDVEWIKDFNKFSKNWIKYPIQSKTRLLQRKRCAISKERLSPCMCVRAPVKLGLDT